MTYKVTEEGNISTVFLNGEIDMDVTDKAKEVILPLVESGKEVHLVARNESEVKKLSEELGCTFTVADVLENGSKHGMNSYGKTQYSGPCPQPTILFQQSTDARTPPITAQSRPYFIKLYALDKELNLAPMADRDILLQEIDGHIVGAGELSVPFKSRKKEMRRGTNVRQY